MSILIPEITGKHSEKRKKAITRWQPKEYKIPKYKLSGGPVFTISLSGWAVPTTASYQLLHHWINGSHFGHSRQLAHLKARFY